VAAKGNSIQWARVDVSDYDNKLWEVFNIEVVPTIVLFKSGKPVWRKDGVLGRGLSEDVIKETIAKMGALGSQN